MSNVLGGTLRWILIGVLMLMGLSVCAQNENRTIVVSKIDSIDLKNVDTKTEGVQLESSCEGEFADLNARDDSVSKKARLNFSRLYIPRHTIAYFSESYYGGCGIWDLHEGLNANVGMYVTTSFGRNRFPGVGFGVGVSTMYAKMLTNRLSLAAGGFYNHLVWGSSSINQVGLNLMLGYQLTDRLSVYGYVSRAFTPSNIETLIPVFPYLDCYGSRFGAMFHFNVNEHVSVSVSVEELRR